MLVGLIHIGLHVALPPFSSQYDGKTYIIKTNSKRIQIKTNERFVVNSSLPQPSLSLSLFFSLSLSLYFLTVKAFRVSYTYKVNLKRNSLHILGQRPCKRILITKRQYLDPKMQGQLQTVLNQRLYFILLLTSIQKCRFCCLVVKKIPNCFIAKTHNVKTKKKKKNTSHQRR